MPFGKHRGKRVGEIPENYRVWVLESCDINPTLRQAIEESLGLNKQQTTRVPALPLEELVAPWYRRLATEFHPDRRGSHEAMLAVNRAHELLLELGGAR